MPSRARIVSGLVALAALLLAPLSEASLTRATSPAAERSALELALQSSAAGPSEFSLFEGNELARAAADAARNEAFHPLAAVSLLSKNGAEGPLVSAGEASYPKTRYRVFELLGTRIVGVERGVTLTLDWGCADSSCELSSGTVGWLSEDPAGDKDSPNLYGFVGLRPHEKTDPLGLAIRTGMYDATVQGRLAKDDWRYLKWLAEAPSQLVTDNSYRREFLETGGALLRHGLGWLFNRPDWDVMGVGMTGIMRAPAAVSRLPRVLKAGEDLVRSASTIEKGAIELEAPTRLLTAAAEPKLLPAASQGRINQAAGAAFHDAAYEALRLSENKTLVTGTTSKGPVNVVPDLLDKARTGVAEFKDWKKVTFSHQIQAEYDVARQQGTTLSLVISPRTQSVAQRLQAAVRQTGGIIVEFDPATGKFSQVTFDPLHPTRILR